MPEVKEHSGYTLKELAKAVKLPWLQFAKWADPLVTVRNQLREADWRRFRHGYHLAEPVAYSEKRQGLRSRELQLKPTDVNWDVVLVDVRFQANYAHKVSPHDRLAAVRRAQGVVLGAFLLPEKKELESPWTVFISIGAVLGFGEAQRAPPPYTSKPAGPGLDGLPDGEGPFLWAPKDKKGAVLKFVRKLGFTAMVMRPQRETELTLIYYVPKGTKKASLRFHDLPPVVLDLEQQKDGIKKH